ncbi:oxygen-dependent protoporphyrinogen oxidase [Paenibacillus sp. 1_12]|uniref:protoporphyrinogen oxidase n=1 Tax=Paenibacillus sp. 1_12 TaxID=1566278 RepID=UPI0008E98075|nr:protoporphyrinogen oxidase [Paenibacillus sp. 1_12]SFL56621.1 oxygen-dependent protoporphyrinogen oxidase [Paenibacillus sp. 1_12]
MKTIVVIGGGITGLSTAYYLQKTIKAQNRDAKIVLVEANDTLGGKIRTAHEGEFIMETGADSIVSRKTNVAPFLEELDIQKDVVYNATGISYIYTDGELKPIPKEAVFGIPLSLESLAKSNLVSAKGKVEALKDFYTPNETFTKEHSIGEFLEYFLGKELVEKQISPVLSGVYSGQLQDLTIASTLPYLLDYKNKYGSIIQGLAENKQRFLGTGDKKFLSFKHGVSSLVDRIEERLTDVDLYKGVQAEKIKKQQERYLVSLSNHKEIETDFIVLSTLHPVAQHLMLDKALDEDFEQLKNSSLISVYLGFDIPDSELPKDGTGFIVAEDSDLSCNACTWTSRKWEHTSEKKRLLVRLFYKSTCRDYEKLLQMTKEEIVQIARKDIEDSLGITGTPISSDITKWHETMPNYHLKHPQLVKSLENKLAENYPNVILAGCSYYGVGIPDCIMNGEKTAEWIAERL